MYAVTNEINAFEEMAESLAYEDQMKLFKIFKLVERRSKRRRAMKHAGSASPRFVHQPIRGESQRFAVLTAGIRAMCREGVGCAELRPAA